MEAAGTGCRVGESAMKFDWKSQRLDWKIFDGLLIVGAIAAGFGIWFIPSWSHTPGFQKLTAAVHERVELQKKIKAKGPRSRKRTRKRASSISAPAACPSRFSP
jgi:hypothetical protein